MRKLELSSLIFWPLLLKKSATASKPLVLYLFINLSNLLLLLLLLPLLILGGVEMILLFTMDVEEIELEAIYQQQIRERIRLIYPFSMLSNYFYSEK